MANDSKPPFSNYKSAALNQLSYAGVSPYESRFQRVHQEFIMTPLSRTREGRCSRSFFYGAAVLRAKPRNSVKPGASEVRKATDRKPPGRGFVSRHDRLARKTGNASQNFSANALNHYEVPMVTPTPRPRPDATVFEIAFVPA